MERIEDIDRNDQLYLPELPDDVIIDILSRLPVKTIYSFRTVCKPWCSLPNSPAFVETHLIRSLQVPKIIVMSYKTNEGLLSFYSVDISETGNTITLMFTVAPEFKCYSMGPTFDGLVCFVSHSDHSSNKIYICNPSTHAISQLPEVDGSAKLAGFGFDYSSGTYKVLCALPCIQWYLYTLGSGDDSWRPVGCLPFNEYQIEPRENAYIHGVVHWIIQGRDHSNPYVILSFDFSDETFWRVPVPKCRAWKLYLRYLAVHEAIHLKVMDGYLRLIATLDGWDSGFWTIAIWTLKNYKSYKWTYDICFSIDIFEYNLRFSTPVLLDMRNGRVFFSSGNKLYSHNLKRNVTEEINVVCAEDGVRLCNKYFQSNFVESMVPVNFRFW